MSRWKSVERGIAKLLGGQRVPVTGRQRGEAPDIEHDWLSIEVKTREKLPAWIRDAQAQADASNKGNQLSIVILHEKGRRYADSHIMMRLEDFIDWFGGNNEIER